MPIFVLFVSAGVLFVGAFFMGISLSFTILRFALDVALFLRLSYIGGKDLYPT